MESGFEGVLTVGLWIVMAFVILSIGFLVFVTVKELWETLRDN